MALPTLSPFATTTGFQAGMGNGRGGGGGQAQQRIGYRGALGPPSPTSPQAGSPGGGLDWLENARQHDILNQGAKGEIDPVTGLPVNASRGQINSQLQMLAGKGDEAGLEGQGLGGSQQFNAIRNYYKARMSGNQDAINQAASGVYGLQARINSARSRNAPPSYPSAEQSTKFQGQYDPNIDNYGVGDEEDQSQAAYRAKGGPEKMVHPYIVNEKGPESVKYDGEQNPELIPGGEHMTTFPKSGRVIPHGRTMQLMKQGKVAMPAHRASGGNESRSFFPSFTPPPPQVIHESTPSNPNEVQNEPWISNLNPLPYLERAGQAIGDFGDKLFIGHPDSAPPPPNLSSFAKKHSPAEVAMLQRQRQLKRAPTLTGDEMLNENAMYAGNENTFTLPNAPASPTPVAEEPPHEWYDANRAPQWTSSTVEEAANAPTGNWASGLINSLRQGAPIAMAQGAKINNTLNAATSRMMANRGVDQSQSGPLSRSFETPYGKASVAIGPHTAGPHVFNADHTPFVAPSAPTEPPITSYADWEGRQRAKNLANEIALGKQVIAKNNDADRRAGVHFKGINYRAAGGKVSRTRMMMG